MGALATVWYVALASVWSALAGESWEQYAIRLTVVLPPCWIALAFIEGRRRRA